MENTSKTTTQNADVAALIENTLAMQAAVAPRQAAFEEKLKKREARDKDESKMFRRFKIKDIVFLAIITACTLVTSAIMPLLIHVPVFGIIQLGLGLQFFYLSRDRSYEGAQSGFHDHYGYIYRAVFGDDVSADGAHRRVRGGGGTFGVCRLSQL